MKANSLQFIVLIALLAFISCKESKAPEDNGSTNNNKSIDVHSYAKPDEAVIKHLSLDLVVDFTIKKLSGTATYDIEVNEGADSIILDARQLDIHQVTVDGKQTPFTLGTDEEYKASH